MTELLLRYVTLYLEAGFSILPLKTKPDTEGEKPAPYISWKEKQYIRATMNEVNEWINKWGNINIGIVTGRVSSLLVFDCEDEQTYKKLISVLGDFNKDLADTATVQTGKGYHLYYRIDSNLLIPSRIKYEIFKDVIIDVSAEARYVFAPPSIHINGKQYQWIKELDHIKYCNDNDILQILGATIGDSRTEYTGKKKINTNINEVPDEKLRHYLGDKVTNTLSFDQMIHNGIPKGKRNNTLAAISGKLLRHYDPFLSFHLLQYIDAKYCKPPIQSESGIGSLETIIKSIDSQIQNLQGKSGEFTQEKQVIDNIMKTADITIDNITRVRIDTDNICYRLYVSYIDAVSKVKRTIKIQVDSRKILQWNSIISLLLHHTGRLISSSHDTEKINEIWRKYIGYWNKVSAPEIDKPLQMPCKIYNSVMEAYANKKFVKVEAQQLSEIMKDKVCFIECDDTLYINVNRFYQFLRMYNMYDKMAFPAYYANCKIIFGEPVNYNIEYSKHRSFVKSFFVGTMEIFKTKLLKYADSIGMVL